MKKDFDVFEDSAMRDHLLYLYLADVILLKQPTMGYCHAKELSRVIIDDLNEAGFICIS